MFWDKRLLYKGESREKYNEVINILELNDIKYTDKIENKNKGNTSMIDKTIIESKIGNLGQKEDFTYEYSIYVKKDIYEYAESLIK